MGHRFSLGAGLGVSRQRRFTAALFNPLAAAGTLGFYQGSNTTPGVVFSLNDQSGNGRHLMTTLNQPTVAADATLGGALAVQFAGASVLTSAAVMGFSGLPVAEIWYIGRVVSGATNRIVAELGNASTGTDTWLVGYNWTSPASTGPSAFPHSNMGNTWIAYADPAASACVGLVMDLSTSPDTARCYVGGVLQTAIANAGIVDGTNTFGSYTMAFGGRTAGVNPITASIGEIWIRGQRSTAPEIAAYRARALSLYGV